MTTDIKINLDSKHLPQTAAAWQAWKIIIALFTCSFASVVGVLGLIALVAVFTSPMRESEAYKMRREYRDRCLSEFLIANNGMRGDTGFVVCKAKAQLQYPD